MSIVSQLTIISVYRNREISVLKRHLDALAQQTKNGFRYILIDYGSLPTLSDEVKDIIKAYSFVSYFYIETRGWFWSRTHAFNCGILKSNTENIMILDVDMILHPDLLAKLEERWNEKQALVFKVHYLPPDFEDFTALWGNIDHVLSIANKSSNDGRGNILVKKKWFEQIQNYDEFYHFWGGEDGDMIFALDSWGIGFDWFDLKENPILHQWHPEIIKQLPKGWISVKKIC